VHPQVNPAKANKEYQDHEETDQDSFWESIGKGMPCKIDQQSIKADSHNCMATWKA